MIRGREIMDRDSESKLHTLAKEHIFNLLNQHAPINFFLSSPNLLQENESVKINLSEFWKIGPFLELPRLISDEKWLFLELNTCKQCLKRNPNKKFFKCSQWCLSGLKNIIRPDISMGTNERETIFIEIEVSSPLNEEKFGKYFELSKYFPFFLIELEAIQIFEKDLNIKIKNLYHFNNSFTIEDLND